MAGAATPTHPAPTSWGFSGFRQATTGRVGHQHPMGCSSHAASPPSRARASILTSFTHTGTSNQTCSRAFAPIIDGLGEKIPVSASVEDDLQLLNLIWALLKQTDGLLGLRLINNINDKRKIQLIVMQRIHRTHSSHLIEASLSSLIKSDTKTPVLSHLTQTIGCFLLRTEATSAAHPWLQWWCQSWCCITYGQGKHHCPPR